MSYETELAHLVRMSLLPGWKAHAWHRAQQMQASGHWDGIADALKSEMLARKSESAPPLNGG